MSEANTTALAEPYTHRIGNVTFRISSFGNPNGTKSATEMLVQMMEHQLRENLIENARASLRGGFRDKVRLKLREIFGQRFQYDRLASAEEQIDSRLDEDSDLFRERATKLRRAQELERRRSQPGKARRKSRDYEL